MSSLGLVSSSSRPLQVRMRPDLQFWAQTYQGRDYWVLKDPVSLKFYRFEDEEFAILRMLDGQTSSEEICRRFALQFAPQRISPGELSQLIGSLFRSSLLVSDATGQGSILLRRSAVNRKRQARATLSNVLAIRLPGCNPDRLLDRLNRWVGFAFSVPFAICALALLLSAAALVFAHFEQFQSRLPSFQTFFAGRNWFILAATLALTKVLHEMGHGLACKRFGSQCHNMGVMFLVFMPCMYCDVSDSWTIASKWKRAAIAAAGMYFEWILAAICVFIWWFSQPGIVNLMALNVVVVCSITTLLFNANPLLRYDGYYILADLIEIPNLRQKASTVLRRWLGRVTLGLPIADDPFLPKRHRWLFCCYAVAAVVYRWLITLSIFWFVYSLLEPYGLKIISQLIAGMDIYGLIGVPLIQLIRFFSTPGRFGTVNSTRFVTTCVVLVVGAITFLMFPLPHFVHAPFLVQPQDASNVYVEVPGELSQILVHDQARVQQGQDLIYLTNHELQAAIARMEGEVAKAWVRYKATRAQASLDSSVETEVDASLASFESLNDQLLQQRADAEKLRIKSPTSGTVLSARRRNKPADPGGTLVNWHGHMLEQRNLRALVEPGTIVCQIAPDPESLEAILVVDQGEIELIQSGRSVKLWSRQQPGRAFKSKIDLISLSELKVVPKSLATRYGGSLVTRPDSTGNEVPMSTTYQVRVPLHDPNKMLLAGCTGTAKIRTGNQSLGQRLWRTLCKTFRFDL